MAIARKLEPTVVRAFSRSGDTLGLARVAWPNIAPDDVVELATGAVRVFDVVTPSTIVQSRRSVAALGSPAGLPSTH